MLEERSWCKGRGARQRAKWVSEVVRIEERPRTSPSSVPAALGCLKPDTGGVHVGISLCDYPVR